MTRREREHRRRSHVLKARHTLAVVLAVAGHANCGKPRRMRPRHACYVCGREPPRSDGNAAADSAQQLRPGWEASAGDPDHCASVHRAGAWLNVLYLPWLHNANSHCFSRRLLHIHRDTDPVFASCGRHANVAQELTG